ncbi:T9SS type A sorting domain-containing protein [Labilibacter sediminis]|nr:T9SS type A sorting domain-containing protein [Labilibacter sediminis]
MKKINLLFICLICLPAVLSALTLNPSTFTVGNLNNIASGTTVYLEPGTYTITQSVIDAWAAGVKGKSNITFQRTGSGTVVMDGNGFAEQQNVKFENCDNLLVKDITLKNIKLTLWNCTNSTFDNIISREQKFILPEGQDAKEYGKLVSLLAIGHGDNCTISNCTLEYTFTGFNGKVIKSYRGTNHKFINNTITGKMQGAYEIWTAKSEVTNGIEGYSGALVQGGYIERIDANALGGEDHGIYFHDVSDAMIDNVTIKGFTPTAAGGAVKIKNSDNVEVKNCTFYTSGILLRTGSSGWQHLENIYIHDNTIYGGLAISTYMTPNAGFDNPMALVFENNLLYDDGIKMTYNAAKFNQYSSRAGKNGGIYNNGYGNGQTLNITSGVNGVSTNYELDATVGAVTITSPADNASFNSGEAIDVTTSTVGSFQYVSIKVDGIWVAQDSRSPYEFSLTNLTEGEHQIKVYGKLEDNTWAQDHTITVSVNPEPVTYTESFENMILDGWGTESYTGDHGFVWNVDAKGVSGYINNTKGIYFSAGETGVVSNVIPGGISSFSVECKDLWSTGNERKIELLVNGSVVGSRTHTGTEVYTFSLSNIDISGDVTIAVKNASSTAANNTIAIDNITWTTFGLKTATHSVPGFDAQNTVQVYPNPFKSSFKVKMEMEYKQAVLLDISGRVVFTKVLNAQNEFSFSPSYADAPAGIYLLKLISDEETRTVKLVRE